MTIHKGACPACGTALTIDDADLSPVDPEVAALVAATRRQEVDHPTGPPPPSGMSLNGPALTQAAENYVGGVDRSGGTSDDLSAAITRAVGGNGAGALHENGV